jgi:hypothetical protein
LPLKEESREVILLLMNNKVVFTVHCCAEAFKADIDTVPTLQKI